MAGATHATQDKGKGAISTILIKVPLGNHKDQ